MRKVVQQSADKGAMAGAQPPDFFDEGGPEYIRETALKTNYYYV